MARSLFGGSDDDFAYEPFTFAGRKLMALAASKTVTFWTAVTGGTQVTDLLDAGGNPVTSVTTDANGQIPVFSGPDGVIEVWASVDGGPRTRMVTLGRTGATGPTGPTGPQGAPGGSDAAFAGWINDTTPSATRAALSATYAARRGTGAVAIGDSITATSGSGTDDRWLPLACARSFGRLKYMGTFATGGYTSTQILNTHLPSVLAMNPLPSFCFILAGTNDLGTYGATTRSNIISMVTQLLAARITPVLCTIPPQASSPTIDLYNAWLCAYAERNGLSIIDFHGVLVDPSTGNYLSGLNSDAVHPSKAGLTRMADAILASGLMERVPAYPQYRAQSTADGANLLGSAGLFLADTNADGLADGWTGLGDGAGLGRALIADSSIRGRWQRFIRTGGSGITQIQRTVSSGFSPGDRLELSARVRLVGTQAGAVSCYLGAAMSGGTPGNPPEASLMYNWQIDVDGVISQEFLVSPGTTSIPVNIQMAAGTANLDVAEVTLKNLTTLGVS